MYLYRLMRNLVAAAALVAVVSLVTIGNAVPAAFVFIGYVVWLPVRDMLKRAERSRSWNRANTRRKAGPYKPGERMPSGRLY
jgi:hypothetical protein